MFLKIGVQNNKRLYSEAYSEFCEIPMMVIFEKIVNG